jgi:hypothetical protein
MAGATSRMTSRPCGACWDDEDEAQDGSGEDGGES